MQEVATPCRTDQHATVSEGIPEALPEPVPQVLPGVLTESKDSGAAAPEPEGKPVVPKPIPAEEEQTLEPTVSCFIAWFLKNCSTCVVIYMSWLQHLRQRNPKSIWKLLQTL